MPLPTPNPAVPFTVLHADPGFIVISKPNGLVCEPGLGHSSDSIMNGIAARWGAEIALLGEARDHGLVHRLDRDSSGALIVALDARAYDGIRAQFEARTVGKTYLALVQGKPPRREGSIELPLAEVRRGEMKVSLIDRRTGRPAVTRWKTLAAGHGKSLLEVEIETGRLHQIRVHMAELGCPVVSDSVYRVDLPPLTHKPPQGKAMVPLALHAYGLKFLHPVTRAPISVTCPVPAHFAALLKSCEISLS